MLVNKKIKINNKKILIITGHNSFFSSGIHKYLDFYKCKTEFYFKKNQTPQLSELKKIIKKKNKFKPDIILGIGGGSVLDISKMTAAFKNCNISFNSKKSQFHKKLNLILVPTTAGSGSEATNFAVLYKGKNKFSIISNHLKPDRIFFYPDSLKNYNKSNKMSSVLDALCQSIESIFSINSNTKSLAFAKKSLNILNKNLKEYLKGNSSTFKNMFLASNFAGKAINITKTNVPHALSYYLTSKFKIDHGYAVFLNFFGFLNFIYNSKEKRKFFDRRFKILFKVFKVRKNHNNPLEIFFNKILELIAVNINYNKFSINRDAEVNKMIKNINLERLRNCPIKLSKKSIKKIIFFNHRSR